MTRRTRLGWLLGVWSIGLVLMYAVIRLLGYEHIPPAWLQAWIVAGALVLLTPSFGVATTGRSQALMLACGATLVLVFPMVVSLSPEMLHPSGRWLDIVYWLWAVSIVGGALILISVIAWLENRSHTLKPAPDRFPRKILVIPALVILLFIALTRPVFDLAMLFGVLLVTAWWMNIWAIWAGGTALAYVVLVPHALWILVREPLCRTAKNVFAIAVATVCLIGVALDFLHPGDGPSEWLNQRLWPLLRIEPSGLSKGPRVILTPTPILAPTP